jgi:hypothetical protein
MLGTFWEAFAGKLAEQWAARLLSPALVFWAGGLAAWLWSKPDGWRAAADEYNRTLEDVSAAGQVGVLIGALLLMLGSAALADRLTLPVLRLLEGYWPGWLTAPLLSRRRERLKHAKRTAQEIARVATSDHERKQLAGLERTLRRYPDPDLILPTRLGNVLRLAETRPRERYGLDAVVCWPYLWLVLDEHTRTEVTRARMALNGAARGWLWSIAFAVWTPLAWWALPAATIGAGFAYYLTALSTAQTYGTLVEAAFALNRHRLYEALRWPLPETRYDEQEKGEELTLYLWRGIPPDDARLAGA